MPKATSMFARLVVEELRNSRAGTRAIFARASR